MIVSTTPQEKNSLQNQVNSSVVGNDNICQQANTIK
jgi:hypothetical protein